jgi:hypothetical protein
MKLKMLPILKRLRLKVCLARWRLIVHEFMSFVVGLGCLEVILESPPLLLERYFTLKNVQLPVVNRSGILFVGGTSVYHHRFFVLFNYLLKVSLT